MSDNLTVRDILRGAPSFAYVADGSSQAIADLDDAIADLAAARERLAEATRAVAAAEAEVQAARARAMVWNQALRQAQDVLRRREVIESN